MIYLLKLGASFILPPGIFIVIMAVLAVMLWRKNPRAARVLSVLTVCFYLLTTSYIADMMMQSLEGRYTPPARVRGDVVIMLGGGATADTPDVDGLGNLSGSAANRLLAAVRLQRNLDVPIIVAGGQVYSDSGREALVAKRILMGLGVEETKIIVEDQSLNTKQNAQFVHKILQERGYSRPILVTSAFHMDRSVINFQKEAVEVIPFPADYLTNKKNDFYFNKLAPSAGALENSCIVFREWLGIVVAKIVK